MTTEQLNKHYKLSKVSSGRMCGGCAFDGDTEREVDCQLNLFCYADIEMVYVKRQPEKNK